MSVRENRAGLEMTFEAAASRWYIEVGQHNSAQETILRNLKWLQDRIGAHTPLSSITDALVAELVAKRRGEVVPGRKEQRRVQPATVNRTMTQPLREIVNRARDVWGEKVSRIDFSRHMLAEPQERVREASADEEDAIMGALGRGYDVAVRFAFLTGCRRMEILGLDWPHVDFFSRRFTVTGKGNRFRTIPMSQAIHDLLWDERTRHPRKVFTFEAARTLKAQGLVKGQRYPLTESGLKTAMRRAVANAGVENFRFHDTRHTAATRVLRASNLRVAQKLLGHSDPKTTAKYAHAMDDDIRNALDASVARSPTKNVETGVDDASKNMKGLRKGE